MPQGNDGQEGRRGSRSNLSQPDSRAALRFGESVSFRFRGENRPLWMQAAATARAKNPEVLTNLWCGAFNHAVRPPVPESVLKAPGGA